ncbi:MAG TPA: hypothetical protein DCG75_02105, partial [Bacteroidales bacterium]|nr:hypothetical protein [Bacteroidales bacterium]
VTVSILTAPNGSEGTATVNGDNTITFTPAVSYSGVSSFGYTVTDNDGDSDDARATITVLEDGETNHIPLAKDDTAETEMNTSVE